MKFPHTHFRRGQRVRIVLRDGSVHVHKFHDRIARAIVVSTGEKFATNTLRSVTIFKQSIADVRR